MTIANPFGKGVRNLLCEAPEGPFRQKVPDTFTKPLPFANAKLTRRRMMGSLAACCVATTRTIRAADPATATWITHETTAAIDLGLAYLASRQNDDGSLQGTSYGRNVGVCGLVGMAFLAQGSTPRRGPYGRQVRSCVDYLLSHAEPSGFIVAPGSVSHGPMYGHGFATLFLTQVYGMSRQPGLRSKLAKAIRLIIDTQNDDGGWRYQPQKLDADLSVTICQIMALRAARNVGFFVPNETIERCVDYVKRCQNSDGGFRYMLEPGPSAFPRSAAGVVALYSAGIYNDDVVSGGLAYLQQHIPAASDRQREGHFFYGHYYGAVAMWYAGGEYWRRWYPAIRDALLVRQSSDGGWLDAVGPEYGTAMAAIILQLPKNCLPIFDR